MGVNGLQILVADDHARMRDCIVCVLSAEFEVVGAVSDGDELVKARTERVALTNLVRCLPRTWK
jgi:DNA-binding NarL/FixJ family response regulator